MVNDVTDTVLVLLQFTNDAFDFAAVHRRE